LSALAPQSLGLVRIVPDFGILQLGEDLGQPFLLAGVVKDTP